MLYPMPAILVGANVDNKPDFATVAWCGIVNGNPPTISISLQHHRHSLKGIRQNNTFSANIPSADQAKETDYCGIFSGSKTDKAADCGFKVIYGKLNTAPMIDQCPVNLECRVLHTLNLGSHTMVVGQIEEVYISESCLTRGQPDIEKINPLLWIVWNVIPGDKPAEADAPQGNQYREIGRIIGESRKLGRQLKKEQHGYTP